MKKGILRNFLAILAGWIIGSIVNISIVKVGPSIFGVPEGVDIMDINSIRENINLYLPQHFVGPILAHGLGTLVGAFVAAKIALNNKKINALVIGGIFMLGGLGMVYYLPEQPIWVMVTDLGLAYLPMAYLGYRIAK